MGGLLYESHCIYGLWQRDESERDILIVLISMVDFIFTVISGDYASKYIELWHFYIHYNMITLHYTVTNTFLSSDISQTADD